MTQSRREAHLRAAVGICEVFEMVSHDLVRLWSLRNPDNGRVTRSGIKAPGGSGGVDADESCRCREPCIGAGGSVSSCLWMWLVRCFCETQRAAFDCRLLAWSNDAELEELGRGVEWMCLAGGARR